MDKLAMDFKIINTFITVCTQFLEISYVDRVELRVLAKEMASLELPTVDWWNTVEKFGRTKYKLHQ